MTKPHPIIFIAFANPKHDLNLPKEQLKIKRALRQSFLIKN
ncbi:hypothetical protein M23134_00295 [Microscilla marina ATCC 23134]|uniref:Uncharacterized protein n=1 Tax=Microscilla marina ATCC 23134 TaxID=313606 RepID=A1ZP62_MICM2|nr:hypothetical protein M23134_00295 [Microscilla marina ATCC 23134]